MAEFRERPYSQFNYLVTLGDGDPASPNAGFQEVSGLGLEINVAEYRAGNARENGPMKIHGTYKVTDVTLKRGVIGATDLTEWLFPVRDGEQTESLQTVTIELLSEDRQTTAITWKLANTRPIKYTGPALNAKGTDVAIEELVLACERIDVE